MPRFATTLMAGLLSLASVAAQAAETASLIRSPQCDCCLGYAEELRQSGFVVTVTDAEDLSAVKRQHGVPEALDGCHTTLVGGYVVEGHVPIAIVSKLLRERPNVTGIPAGHAGGIARDGSRVAQGRVRRCRVPARRSYERVRPALSHSRGSTDTGAQGARALPTRRSRTRARHGGRGSVSSRRPVGWDAFRGVDPGNRVSAVVRKGRGDHSRPVLRALPERPAGARAPARHAG